MSTCGTKKAQSTTQICIKIISQDIRFVLHRIHRCLNCNSELAWYVVLIENVYVHYLTALCRVML